MEYHKLADGLTNSTNLFETEDTFTPANSEYEYKIETRVEIKRIPILHSPIKEETYIKDEPDIIHHHDHEYYATDSIDNDLIWFNSSPSPTHNTRPNNAELLEENESGKPQPNIQFQCVFCKNMYKSKSSLRYHMSSEHRTASHEPSIQSNQQQSENRKTGRKVGRPSTVKDTRTFQCKHCNEMFANRSNYNKHVLTLRNGKPFFCRMCITGFDFRGDLIQHKRTNRECKSPPREKKYLCTYCGKYFEKKDSLRQHTRVHTKERPFECSECGRTFVNKGTLKDHMNSHLGLKPYICPVPECKKAFRLACTLKQHKVNVHEPPTFKCNFCDKMFSDKKHME